MPWSAKKRCQVRKSERLNGIRSNRLLQLHKLSRMRSILRHPRNHRHIYPLIVLRGIQHRLHNRWKFCPKPRWQSHPRSRFTPSFLQDVTRRSQEQHSSNYIITRRRSTADNSGCQLLRDVGELKLSPGCYIASIWIQVPRACNEV